MGKNLFIVLSVMVAALYFLNTEMTHAEENKCVKGYIKKSTNLCNGQGKLCCYNPETHLSYNEKNDFYIGDGQSYRGTFYCGEECNYDGTGCKSGAQPQPVRG